MMLGNLSIEQMEKRTGVKFPDELVKYMGSRRQQNANNIAKGKWHCFDMPFTLVCGGRETATEIHKHLAPLGDDFKEQMQISVSS